MLSILLLVVSVEWAQGATYSNIAGASSTRYQPSSDDVGARRRLRVVYIPVRKSDGVKGAAAVCEVPQQ